MGADELSRQAVPQEHYTQGTTLIEGLSTRRLCSLLDSKGACDASDRYKGR